MALNYKPLWIQLIKKNLMKVDVIRMAGLTTNVMAQMGKISSLYLKTLREYARHLNALLMMWLVLMIVMERKKMSKVKNKYSGYKNEYSAWLNDKIWEKWYNRMDEKLTNFEFIVKHLSEMVDVFLLAWIVLELSVMGIFWTIIRVKINIDINLCIVYNTKHRQLSM